MTRKLSFPEAEKLHQDLCYMLSTLEIGLQCRFSCNSYSGWEIRLAEQLLVAEDENYIGLTDMIVSDIYDEQSYTSILQYLLSTLQ